MRVRIIIIVETEDSENILFEDNLTEAQIKQLGLDVFEYLLEWER